jgi:glycosyltransferase involved in cell wall biosynthesis
LIPVHDARPYLAAALASVRRQTMRDFEVVCVDDGSTDGGGDELDHVAREDARFRVLHPGRIGLVAAANLLAAEARAPLLARFDADDVMHPRRLELQAAFLDAHPDVGAVSSLVRHFPGADVREGNRVYEAWLNGIVTPEQIAREIFVELPLPNPATTMRAGVHARAGGFRDDGMPEDYAFWLRAWEAGVRFAKVARVLHFWREHPARVTRTHPRYALEAFLRAKAATLLRGPLGGVRPYLVWGAGMIGRRLARILERAGRPPLAMLDIDPRKIGGRRRGVPVLPPDAIRPRSALVLAAVGARGARGKIRAALVRAGWRETIDFWMVA